jgi:hypothetical protein
MTAEIDPNAVSTPQQALYTIGILTLYFALGTLDLPKLPPQPAGVNAIPNRTLELNGKE